jgi:hypothetical protein
VGGHPQLVGPHGGHAAPGTPVFFLERRGNLLQAPGRPLGELIMTHTSHLLLGAPLRLLGHPAGQKLASPPGIAAILIPHPAEALQKLVVLFGLSSQGLVLFAPSKATPQNASFTPLASLARLAIYLDA